MEHVKKGKLEQLKEEYRKISMPSSVNERMRIGIEKAKREKRMRIMTKVTKRTGLTVAAALVAITIMANASPTTAQAMESVPLIGNIAKVVTFRTFEDTKDHYQAKIDVPKVSVGDHDNSAANQSIEDYSNQLIADYEEKVKEDWAGKGYYSVDSSYDVVTNDAKYLSVRITTTVAAADAAEIVKIFNIDKATGQVVELKDLFQNKPDYIQAISDNIKEQMKEQMAADDSIHYFYDDGDSQDFNQITDDQNFYINKDGKLVISFDKFAVAPGYMGKVEFTIPESVTGALS